MRTWNFLRVFFSFLFFFCFQFLSCFSLFQDFSFNCLPPFFLLLSSLDFPFRVYFFRRLNQIGNVDRHLFDGCVIMLLQFLQCTTISVGNKVDRDTLATETSTTTDSRKKVGLVKLSRNSAKCEWRHRHHRCIISQKFQLTYEYSSHEH